MDNIFADTSTCQPKEIQDAYFTTEIRAGMTTFATMSYIIAVNVWGLDIMTHPGCPDEADCFQAFILAESGYDCPCEKPWTAKGTCKNMDAWMECYEGLCNVFALLLCNSVP